MAAINPLNPQVSTYAYYPMLQESTQHFFTQLNSGISDFSHFNLMFSRLIQTMPSPPIEIIWFYTAVNYHTHKNLTKVQDHNNLDQILCLEELFQSLVSCSGSCSSSVNRVAVLAPLVYELHCLIIELKLPSKNNVVGKEISCLVDRLVSYISLCCCQGVDDHDDSLAFSPCFVELVKVWTVGRRGNGFDFEDDFRVFFPFVSDEGRKELWLGGGAGLLAGFVMCQVFMINLCLKFSVVERSQNLEEEVMNLAIETITGFRSCYFFDALLKMLLESNLPTPSLLAATDEVVLREALFAAVVLVNYPFFNPACGIRLCNRHLNSLASTWLFVADRAMQFARSNGGQTKVIVYMKAFSRSLIYSQLMRWVSVQVGMVEDANRLNMSSPAAFLEWLVQFRDVGSQSFDSEFSTFLDKAMHYKSEMTSNLPFFEADVNKEFYLDQKLGLDNGFEGDFEMMDSTDDVKSACQSGLSSSETCRKRKGEKDEDSIRAKLLKYHIQGSPINNYSAFQAEIGLARRS